MCLLMTDLYFIWMLKSSHSSNVSRKENKKGNNKKYMHDDDTEKQKLR